MLNIVVEKVILPLETIFLDLLNCHKMIFNASIIFLILRVAKPVNRRAVGCVVLPLEKDVRNCQTGNTVGLQKGNDIFQDYKIIRGGKTCN